MKSETKTTPPLDERALEAALDVYSKSFGEYACDITYDGVKAAIRAYLFSTHPPEIEPGAVGADLPPLGQGGHAYGCPMTHVPIFDARCACGEMARWGRSKPAPEIEPGAVGDVVSRAAAIEAILAGQQGGHCGESTSEKIARQRFEAHMEVAANIVRLLPRYTPPTTDARADTEWRSPETAPKDGRFIMVTTGGGLPWFVAWRNNHHGRRPAWRHMDGGETIEFAAWQPVPTWPVGEVVADNEWQVDPHTGIRFRLSRHADARDDGVVAGLEEALRGFLHWADQKCPCENEEPNPCPLCGASVENLEGCKAADSTLPKRLLENARSALACARISGAKNDR